MFQIGVVSQIKLQAGKIDLILLVIVALVLINRVTFKDSLVIGLSAAVIIGLVSAEPFIFVLFFYMSVVLFVFFIRSRVWKIPLITMFFSVGLATILHHAVFGLYLILDGANFGASALIQRVIVPSLMLNTLAVIPVYFLVLEGWQWFSPIEEEE
jgi:hypothetical protein